MAGVVQGKQPWFVEASQSISDFSLDATMRQLRSWATEHTIEPMFSTPFAADIRTSNSSFETETVLGPTATTAPTQRDFAHSFNQ